MKELHTYLIYPMIAIPHADDPSYIFRNRTSDVLLFNLYTQQSEPTSSLEITLVNRGDIVSGMQRQLDPAILHGR